eukprot:15459564-Alexandrium_andersonii.AAC.1
MNLRPLAGMRGTPMHHKALDAHPPVPRDLGLLLRFTTVRNLRRAAPAQRLLRSRSTKRTQ